MPSTSAGETVATPALETSIPAAKLATSAASRTLAPAASAVPTHAVTVSPAPDTSYTSRAIVGMRVISPSLVTRIIPAAPGVGSRWSTASLPRALGRASGKLAVDNLLLTLGAEGMILVTKDGEITRIPTMAREVYDVSGAGDTVTAWVGTALAAGASVRDAADVANFAAGIEVSKAGVATVSPAEVLGMHEQDYDQIGKLRREGLL